MERDHMMLQPGSGKGEALGRPRAPQVVPVRWGRGSPPACAWSPVPRPSLRSSRALQAAVLPALLPSAPCLCLLCTPIAWATVSALPSFLPSPRLSPARFPAHVGSLPPGCELLGGRPSINVTCCCQLCCQPRASPAWLTESSRQPLDATAAATPGRPPSPLAELGQSELQQ